MRREEEEEYFRVSEAFSREGFFSNLSSGSRVARGFSDIGFEEFFVLPGGSKLASLFTGEVVPLVPEERSRFFLLPSLEEIERELSVRAIVVSEVVYFEQREWSVRLENGSSHSETVAESLPLALLRATAELLGVNLPATSGRLLKTCERR